MRRFLPFATLFVFSSVALAQSPALPGNYKVELDNAYVRVTRASFRPHETVPVHLHPTFPTVYVYLTDGGPMRFTHITPSYTVLRPPVRTGGVRYNRNWHDETHVIEYLGDMPTEYFRIEMKTVPDQPHRDARMAPEDTTPIEDTQVRISRHQCGPGESCSLPSASVIVNLNDRSFTWTPPNHIAGLVGGSTPSAQIWIELKTPPGK